MTYVITQSCCADASCVAVCPVNCIHPTPDEPDFGKVDSLYVDPAACIDCGACADACPVSAAQPADSLTGLAQRFVDINADFYADRDVEPVWTAPAFTHTTDEDGGRLRIAIVGTGPAASYTARHLLTTTDCLVTMIERDQSPGGLLRAGVAPDHTATRAMLDSFRWVYRHPRTTMHLGVEVGRDVSNEDLLRHHHAVIHATGARRSRPLGVPGEELPGVVGAGEMVAWYNGVPREDAPQVRLVGERAVVVGNGNVALDVARVLLATPDVVAQSDLSTEARNALAGSTIREVVLLGRRGPEHAAFTRPELLMLPASMEAEVVLADAPGMSEALEQITEPRLSVLDELPRRPVDLSRPPEPGRRIVLAFDTSVAQVHGPDRVQGVRLRRGAADADELDAEAGLLVRATGFAVEATPGVPFDAGSDRIPHLEGRVLDEQDGSPTPGVYVVGWAKRGARGGIGANRRDAEETVASLLDDAVQGRLAAPDGSGGGLRRSLRRKGSRISTRKGLRIMDLEHERRRTR